MNTVPYDATQPEDQRLTLAVTSPAALLSNTIIAPLRTLPPAPPGNSGSLLLLPLLLLLPPAVTAAGSLLASLKLASSCCSAATSAGLPPTRSKRLRRT
jgi:hypothetical protein